MTLRRVVSCLAVVYATVSLLSAVSVSGQPTVQPSAAASCVAGTYSLSGACAIAPEGDFDLS
jgi:hypothetical protein